MMCGVQAATWTLLISFRAFVDAQANLWESTGRGNECFLNTRIDSLRHATKACVRVRIATTCPRSRGSEFACLPIEPLIHKEWRVPNDETTSKLGEDAVYKSQVVDIGQYDRRIYFDLGAKTYNSSIGGWFKTQYPGASTFDKIIAIEAEDSYDATYQGHEDVELVHAAVWTADRQVPWGTKYVVDDKSQQNRGTKQGIDLAAFLRSHVTANDFVVVKMDIEGAEWEVVPHLVRHGAIRLIDDLFVEMHTNINSCCHNRKDRTRKLAIGLLQRLRDREVYVHEFN